jgi:hypothetical protein
MRGFPKWKPGYKIQPRGKEQSLTRVIRTSLNVVLLGFAICAVSNADSIAYSGSFATGSGITSYTITTDGNTGMLAQSDITSATISDVGTDAFSSTPVTGILTLGADLDFTSTTVTFNFSGSDQGHLDLFGSDHAVEFCATGGCGGYAPGDSGEILDPNFPSGDIILVSGTQVIATVATAPEPPTPFTALGGALLLGFAALRHRLQTRPS